MAVDTSRAGVNRGRRPDETASKTPVDLTWARSRRDTKSPVSAEDSAALVAFVVEGSDAGAGVTEIVLKHGDLALETEAPGIPTAVGLVLNQIAVSFISTSAPAGDWTATLQARDVAAGALYFRDVATFDVTTS